MHNRRRCATATDNTNKSIREVSEIGIMNSTTTKSAPQPQSMPNSPFFRPSNPRISRVESPHGTERTSIVVKKRISRGGGGESKEIPLQDLEKKSSVFGAYANLCNVTIGAGIIGLPYAIKEAGLVSGSIMIVACAILTDYSLRQLISAGKHANVNSYETLMEAAFGRPGFIFLSLNMFFLNYGSMVAFLIIIKDVLPVLFHVTPHDDDIKRIIMIGSSLLVLVPLSMQRDMADLEKTSRMNVLLDICLVAIVVAFSPVNEMVEAQGGILQMIWDEPFLDFRTFFVGFGVCSFAFVCQDSSFIIAGSLEEPTKRRWKQVTNGAMLTCCTLELLMGISGYLAYQTNTLGNVLNNMNAHHWSGVVSRAMLATTMFFAYPLNLYIARHAFVALFFKGTSAHEGDDSVALLRFDRRVILTWVLYIASVVPATLMESTGIVLSVTGTIAGSSIGYIGPGLAFLGINSTTFIELVRKRWDASSKHLWGYPKKFGAEEDGEEAYASGHLQLNKNGGGGQDTINQESMTRASKLDVIFWFVFGMPLWSWLAQIGQKNLANHFEKEEMMSPSIVKPKRLSLAKPTWHYDKASTGISVNSIGITNACANDTEQTSLLLQPVSGSAYGASTASENLLDGKVNGNLAADEIEMEPKTDGPTWLEFRIAIAYVILGVVAMLFGLISVLFL
mmetsp:Transcript_30790/g.66566  ORF Transcript_30790/g.66566 Transcript_30790/m.66566 type:complete len:677 (+) Transcript_30790:78-2108(+)